MVMVPVFIKICKTLTIVSAYLRYMNRFGSQESFLSLGLVGHHLLSGFRCNILWNVVLDQMVDLLYRQVRAKNKPFDFNSAEEATGPCTGPVDITFEVLIFNTLTRKDLTHTLKDFRLLRGSYKTHKSLLFLLLRNRMRLLTLFRLFKNCIKLLRCTFKQSDLI
jgi:hypothetical protein